MTPFILASFPIFASCLMYNRLSMSSCIQTLYHGVKDGINLTLTIPLLSILAFNACHKKVMPKWHGVQVAPFRCLINTTFMDYIITLVFSFNLSGGLKIFLLLPYK